VIRAVVDTNVLFGGLTAAGPAAEVVDAWVTEQFRPCVSTALALEYEDVLARKLGPARAETARRALQALLNRCEWVPVYFSYRPASQDRGDDLVVDCVLNSGSMLVTYNVKDFTRPAREFSFVVHRPKEFLEVLAEEKTP
jgi:predicted nucleic acid-binding protein